MGGQIKSLKVGVNPELHRRTKVRAAEQGTTMSRYVSEALERALEASGKQSEKEERS